jgi:hypothetical protein
MKPASPRIISALLCVLAACWLSCSDLPYAPVHLVHVTGVAVRANGGPVTGAIFRFHPLRYTLQSWQGFPRGETDSTGTFQLDVIEGPYVIEMRGGPPGFYGDYFDYAFRHDVQTEITTENSTFRWVIPGVQIQGRLRSPIGDPLQYGDFSLRTSSDVFTTEMNDSVFTFLVPPGTYALRAIPPSRSGFSVQDFGMFSFLADTTLDLTLSGIEVTGLVRGPGGAPLNGAVVSAQGFQRRTDSVTDGSGLYRMYLPQGDYRFLATPEQQPWILPRLTASLPITTPGTVDLDLSGVEWIGQVVVSGTTVPVQDAVVRAVLVADAYNRAASDSTDAAGEFRLVLEPGRDYDLYALKGSTRGGIVSRVAILDTTFALELAIPTP